VDDDDVVRLLLQTILERAGYIVLSAKDGPEAIQIAARISFDMLITDSRKPHMIGFVLAEQITNDRPAQPVLIVSGAAMEELPLEQIVDRDWSFLPKIDRSHPFARNYCRKLPNRGLSIHLNCTCQHLDWTAKAKY
jgi:CheY-like chemotaxis protein